MQIRQRTFSSTDVTRAFLERIDAYDARLRAFITVDAERALAAAQRADSVYARDVRARRLSTQPCR